MNSAEPGATVEMHEIGKTGNCVAIQEGTRRYGKRPGCEEDRRGALMHMMHMGHVTGENVRHMLIRTLVLPDLRNSVSSFL